MALKKQKNEWTYHIFHSYKRGDDEYSFLTQLYKSLGVYGIVNSDPAMQGAYYPKDIVKIEKKLNKDFEQGIITDLKYGRSITVIEDEDGFFTEKEE